MKIKLKTQCPEVAVMPPMSSCRDSVSTCWSVGEPDWDCPDSGLCCFDGCANTCLGQPQPQPQLQAQPQQSQPVLSPQSANAAVSAGTSGGARGGTNGATSGGASGGASGAAQRPRPSNINQVSQHQPFDVL